jgi:hypothetical protein
VEGAGRVMLTGEQIDMWDYWDEEQHNDHVGKSVLDMVDEYAETTKQEPDPTLYSDLIHEEFNEWLETWSYSLGDTEENLKELSDLVYVIYGYALSRGWDLDEAVRRVHENNMGRMYQPDGTIKRREDGKIVKNPEYPKVDLSDLL